MHSGQGNLFDSMPAPTIPAAPAPAPPVFAPAPAIEREWIYEELPAVPLEDFGPECWPLLLELEAIGEGLSVRDRRFARSMRTALERGRRIHGVWFGWLREAVASYANVENEGDN